MTGFARVKQVTPHGEAVLSVKSVNHRGLDLHFHIPAELDPFEAALRDAVKSRVARGHVQIHIQFNPSAEIAASVLNKPMLGAYVKAFQEAAQAFSIHGQPDVNAALRIPGMLRAEGDAEFGTGMEKALTGAMRNALEILNDFREREGAEIVEEMRGRCATIVGHAEQMEEIRLRAVPEFQKRLKERMRTLLRGAGMEPQRLAQEAALLADKSDIAEELMRLKTHAAQLAGLLDGDGEVGKKLDFLLQEMNRETNTILSKTGGLGDLGLKITDLALATKAEIDKIREQSLNLE